MDTNSESASIVLSTFLTCVSMLHLMQKIGQINNETVIAYGKNCILECNSSYLHHLHQFSVLYLFSEKKQMSSELYVNVYNNDPFNCLNLLFCCILKSSVSVITSYSGTKKLFFDL